MEMNDVMNIVSFALVGLFLYWRGFVRGVTVGYMSKHKQPKVFNLEIDEHGDDVLFYELPANKFLFQKATLEEGIEELHRTLEPETMIIVSRKPHNETV